MTYLLAYIVATTIITSLYCKFVDKEDILGQIEDIRDESGNKHALTVLIVGILSSPITLPLYHKYINLSK